MELILRSNDTPAGATQRGWARACRPCPAKPRGAERRHHPCNAARRIVRSRNHSPDAETVIHIKEYISGCRRAFAVIEPGIFDKLQKESRRGRVCFARTGLDFQREQLECRIRTV